MSKKSFWTRHLGAGRSWLALLTLAAWSGPAFAQTQSGDIIVTATKRSDATVQTAPLAITAFGEEQLERQQFRSLESLAYSIPNVQLSPGGAIPGAANFTIRGLGIASTIPSIDPTVGLFVDGIYQGITIGSLFDTFDVEAIEVLRGPQGVLFGKNVTGGAVLVRTTKPSNDFKVDAQASVESGLNYTGQAVISGPLVKDILQAKFGVYYNRDDGWFKNQATGDSLGASRTWLARGALRWTPKDAIEVMLRYEHGSNEQYDSPVSQNRALYSKSGHKVEQSTTPTQNADYGGPANWDSATLEGNFDVGLGNGTITSLTGYRRLSQNSTFDVDGTAINFFDSNNFNRQHQWSQELRYAGTFGAFDVTTGLYYFTQDIKYIENRSIGNGALVVNGGGTQSTDTYGVFGAVDWHLTDQLTVNGGIRYTEEEKDVEVARIRGGGGGCNLMTLTCTPDFIDSAKFDGLSPKVGLQWQPMDATQFYGFWTKGFRSGGYNLRNTAVGVPPGPFDDEKQTSFEAGVKTDLLDRRLRFNAAVFHTKIKDMQREINASDPVVGVVQVISNTADATLQGVEVEASLQVTEELTLNGNLGYTHGEYDSVRADLNRDGVLNDADKNLRIPRLAPWTYSVGATYVKPLAIGTLNARVNYAFRDDNFYTDANTTNPGTLMSKSNILDASIGLGFNEDTMTFTLYGRNLLNDTTENSIAPLPPTFGGPGANLTLINKGRILGAALRYKY